MARQDWFHVIKVTMRPGKGAFKFEKFSNLEDLQRRINSECHTPSVLYSAKEYRYVGTMMKLNSHHLKKKKKCSIGIPFAVSSKLSHVLKYCIVCCIPVETWHTSWTTRRQKIHRLLFFSPPWNRVLYLHSIKVLFILRFALESYNSRESCFFLLESISRNHDWWKTLNAHCSNGCKCRRRRFSRLFSIIWDSKSAREKLEYKRYTLVYFYRRTFCKL